MINSKKTINKKNGHNIKAGNKHSGENKIVLVGLMGAGKTSIGRRLATRLGLPFSDADDEIEKAAACFKKACQLDKLDVHSAIDRYTCEMKLKHYRRATKALLPSYKRLKSRNLSVALRVAVGCQKDKRTNECIEILEETLMEFWKRMCPMMKILTPFGFARFGTIAEEEEEPGTRVKYLNRKQRHDRTAALKDLNHDLPLLELLIDQYLSLDNYKSIIKFGTYSFQS